MSSATSRIQFASVPLHSLEAYMNLGILLSSRRDGSRDVSKRKDRLEGVTWCAGQREEAGRTVLEQGLRWGSLEKNVSHEVTDTCW